MSIGEVIAKSSQIAGQEIGHPGGENPAINKKSAMQQENAGLRETTISREQLQDAAKKLTRAAQIFGYKIHFKIHDATKRVMVQVINQETGEVVNEVPPEKILDMVAEIWRQVGFLVDKRV